MDHIVGKIDFVQPHHLPEKGDLYRYRDGPGKFWIISRFKDKYPVDPGHNTWWVRVEEPYAGRPVGFQFARGFLALRLPDGTVEDTTKDLVLLERDGRPALN